jgi:hypothetical protein
LLIIGRDQQVVQYGMSNVRSYINKKHSDEEDVEIIGLVHSSTFDSYQMFLEGRDKSFFFVCDRVAKSLELEENKVNSAQRLKRKRDDE